MAAFNVCEMCEQRPQVTQGLCRTCITEGLRKIQAEQDPTLERYLRLLKYPNVFAPNVAVRL